MAPETLSDISKRGTKPYKLQIHNSFVRRSVYFIFNGTENLLYLGPKIRDLLPNEIKQLYSLKSFKLGLI